MERAYAATPARRLKPLPPQLLSDERLARLASEGDGAAFAVIYRRYHDRLYRYCRSMLTNPEDASDAFQATMTSAFHALQGERREITLKPWLYRIAHNEAISVLRRRRPHDELSHAAEVAVPDAAEDADTRARLRQLVSDLGEIGARQRGSLVMRELSGLSYDEIAEIFGFSPAAARQTVYEARRALHEIEEGRAMACDLIREQLSEAEGRRVRSPKIRAHLKACSPCRDFRAAMSTRPADLAAIAPPVAPVLAASVLESLISGAGTASAKGAAAATVAGGSAKVAVGSGIVKAVAVAAVTVTAGAGAGVALVERAEDGSDRRAAPASERSRGEESRQAAGRETETASKRRRDRQARERAADRKAAGQDTPGAAGTGEAAGPRELGRKGAPGVQPRSRVPQERVPARPPVPTRPVPAPQSVTRAPATPPRPAPTPAPAPQAAPTVPAPAPAPVVPEAPERPTAPVDRSSVPAR